jgi:hypothetical protein
LQVNPLTSGLLYTPSNCADLWLWYVYKNVLKSSSKFVFAVNTYYPINPKLERKGEPTKSEPAQKLIKEYAKVHDDQSELYQDLQR